MKNYFLLIVLAISIFGCLDKTQAQTKPNIIYILADDMGYGDIASYNKNGKIKTPGLDKLASEGMSFMDAHTSSSVCTPTRYGILTGRYNWRSTLKKGADWHLDEREIFMKKEFRLSDGTIWKPKRVERPFVLTDDKGQPIMVYVAVADKNINGNIAIPIKREIVKDKGFDGYSL